MLEEGFPEQRHLQTFRIFCFLDSSECMFFTSSSSPRVFFHLLPSSNSFVVSDESINKNDTPLHQSQHLDHLDLHPSDKEREKHKNTAL
jgi:hypothetical protein